MMFSRGKERLLAVSRLCQYMSDKGATILLNAIEFKYSPDYGVYVVSKVLIKGVCTYVCM